MSGPGRLAYGCWVGGGGKRVDLENGDVSIWLAVGGFSIVVPRQGGIGETIWDMGFCRWQREHHFFGTQAMMKVAQSGLGQLSSGWGSL